MYRRCCLSLCMGYFWYVAHKHFSILTLPKPDSANSEFLQKVLITVKTVHAGSEATHGQGVMFCYGEFF